MTCGSCAGTGDFWDREKDDWDLDKKCLNCEGWGEV